MVHHVSCEPEVETEASPPPFMDCRASLILVGDDVPMWWATIKDGPCPQWATAPDLSLLVACEGPRGLEVHVLDTAGRELPGWPVSVPGALADLRWNNFAWACGESIPAVAGSPDGTSYVASTSAGRVSIHAFGRDGLGRPGWPQPLPGDPGGICGLPGFAVAADGSLRTWGYEGLMEDGGGIGYSPFASRTVFSALGLDGTTLDGWPRGSAGTASGPLVAEDGTLYYVSATGRVWGHDGRGEVRPGWPHLLPELARPYLTPDGRLLFVLSDSVVGLTAAGTAAPGWPYDIPGPRQDACFAEFDTDCFGVVGPALSDDGTLYLALEPLAAGRGTAVVALDASARSVPGWPYELEANTYATAIGVLPNGWVALWLTTCDADSCDRLDEPLVLGADGTPVY